MAIKSKELQIYKCRLKANGPQANDNGKTSRFAVITT